MRYGVIVCPNCKKVKAIDLNFNSTRCFNCNKLLKFNKIKIIFKSNSQQEIRSVIGKTNEKLMSK